MTVNIQAIKQRFGIIGNDPELNHAIDIALQVSSTDLSVLITGESGTGKEVFPQIIHQYSARKHGQYIAVNCGAIPEGTIDSELFGHEKGSFTGATDSRKGYFEVADGGTIFLDEVGDFSPTTQVRLLRVIQEREFERLGSVTTIKVDVRIIAATNVDLKKAVEKGEFNTIQHTLRAVVERNKGLYPNLPNVRFLLSTMVSGAISILYGSKGDRDLRRYIKVPNHEENDIRKSIQCTKSTGPVFGYFDYAVQPFCNGIG